MFIKIFDKGAQLIFLGLKLSPYFFGFGKDSLTFLGLKIFNLFFGLTIVMQFILWVSDQMILNRKTAH